MLCTQTTESFSDANLKDKIFDNPSMLPCWYLENVEDYLSILKHANLYNHTDFLQATKQQRLAESNLRTTHLETTSQKPVQKIQQVLDIKQYDESAFYNGYSFTNTRIKKVQMNNWDAVLKRNQ